MAIEFETDEPVKGFPIVFRWAKGPWKEIFEKHVALIRSDLQRAQADDRVIVYLSCPISSRGGAHFRTNVDIANFTARRILSEWGDRLFVLNPASYQLESKEGTGLIMRHIEELFPKGDPAHRLAELKKQYSPGGGDYMRMWTRVLVEDAYLQNSRRKGLNCGGIFDAFYFLGPSDVRQFFSQSAASSWTAGVEEFFARKCATDPDFRSDFEAVKDSVGNVIRTLNVAHRKDADDWLARRKGFFRYYTVRASADYSLGSHDEWNIFVRLNQRRLENELYGVGERIAGFFNGCQLEPSARETLVSAGYEVATVKRPAKKRKALSIRITHPGEISWPRGE